MSGGKKTEVEVKLRVSGAEELEAIVRRLERAGAKRLRRVHEMNTLFDTEERALLKRGCLLRVRTETAMGKDERRAGRKRLRRAGARPRVVVTYKGPAQRKGVAGSRRKAPRYKERAEMEVEVPKAAEAPRLLEALGFRPCFRYEKFRSSFRLPALPGLHVEVDETPIGVFLELEGPRRAIDRAARLLGYSPRDYITVSYGALYVEHCRRMGAEPRDMVFGAAGRGRAGPATAKPRALAGRRAKG